MVVVQHHGVYASASVQDALIGEAKAMVLGDWIAAQFAATYRAAVREARESYKVPKVSGEV